MCLILSRRVEAEDPAVEDMLATVLAYARYCWSFPSGQYLTLRILAVGTLPSDSAEQPIQPS